MNLYDYLLANGETNQAALLTPAETTTYGQLKAEAEAIAARLTAIGIHTGDRVAIFAENSAFWVASYLGIIKIGAVAAPAPARLNPRQITELLDMTGATALCADERRLKQTGILTLTTLPAIIPTKAEATPFPAERVGHPILGETTPTVEVEDARQQLAALMFTSGSTGKPNAVRVSHQNISANTESIIAYLGLTAADRMMTVLPFDYCFGTSLLHTHLRVGGSLVLQNSFVFLEEALDEMERKECTGFAGVPSMYQQLIKQSSLLRRELKHLRYVQQAGGKLADTFIQQFTQALPQVRFFAMYGQTEATARLSYLPPERLPDKLGSIGKGIPGVKLQVLSETGDPVPPGEVGEIVAEGENVALGYWEADAEKNPFREGKLFTGDTAYVDDDGFIFVTGRKSQFLKLVGHRVNIREIEDVLLELPEVVETAVTGGLDENGSEIAVAFVVIQESNAISTEQIRQHCKRRLPIYAVPKRIQIVEDLPKNTSGKVIRALLPVK